MEYTYHTKPKTRKVTMNLPVDLIERAPEFLEKSSLTEAVRDALREAMHRKACQELLDMRESGKAQFKYTWQELRAMDDDK